MPLDLDNLDDAEKFQKHFVTPLVDAVKAEMKPLVDAKLDHESRLSKIESNQKKALLGYAGIVAALTVAFNYVKARWLSKFFS